MKLEGEGEGARLIGVALRDWNDDGLLATGKGKAIRFAGDEVRAVQSRNATGVRGMKLAKEDDEVISLSILHRGGMRDQDEREDYLRFAPWKAEKDGTHTMTDERFAELAGREQVTLTIGRASCRGRV